MWRECIFSFDANMLLNIYRYKPETQERFFVILERLKERIWISHQVATEFYENREVVIAYQLTVYDEVERLLNETYGKLGEKLTGYGKRHASIKAESLLELVEAGIKSAKVSLENDRQAHPDMSSSDPLRDRLVALLDGKVGSPFDNKRLLEIYSEAEQRFGVKQPPGYGDAKKPIPERYGDVIVWLQLIEHAKAERKPLIFVTDDRKEDWWLKRDNKIVSPRPQLANEMQSKAGVGFYMYGSDQFIKYAQEFLDLEARPAAVREVGRVRKQDEAYQSSVDYFAARSWVNLRAFETARLFDNALARRAVDAVRSFDNLLVRQAVENVRSFDSLVARQAIETARAFDNPLTRRAIETARELENPRIRQIIEATKPYDSPNIRRAIEEAGSFHDSRMRQAVEAAEWSRRHHLSGLTFSHDIRADISPKRSSDLQDGASSNDIRVEVLPDTGPEGSTEDETAEDAGVYDERNETPPYEFNVYPMTTTLVHHRDTPHSFKTAHRLRKPTFAEWEEWSLDVERTRRYLSLAELEEHNSRKEEGEEKATEVYQRTYSEWRAGERFYNKLILEVAGVQLSEDDDFPADQFRELPPEIISKLWFELKATVITKLYRCYCGSEKPLRPDTDERRIYQSIDHGSSSFRVIHVLRKPTEGESLAFRTSIVKGFFSTDEDGRESIQLKLNLSTAAEFYNELILNIENATVDGRPYSDETRGAFLAAVNPVYKLRVLEPLFNVNAWYFKIDEWTLP